ncbi:hypothetical protein F4823DRAFT_628096 [Ustulina deusta]|nr:hypothetical protein F4823DRAFT_628096 [Ustulina deusta]
MDGLHIDTFGVLLIDDLSDNSEPSQSTPNLYCINPQKLVPCAKYKGKRPGSQLCWISSLKNGWENGNESSALNKSTLELALHRTRGVRSSSLLSEKEDNHYRTATGNKESAATSPLQLVDGNEEEQLVEESHNIIDVYCSSSRAQDCSCIYHRGDGYRNNDLCPSQDEYNNGYVIEIKIGHVLCLVKDWLALVINWAKQTSIRLAVALKLG